MMRHVFSLVVLYGLLAGLMVTTPVQAQDVQPTLTTENVLAEMSNLAGAVLLPNLGTKGPQVVRQAIPPEPTIAISLTGGRTLRPGRLFQGYYTPLKPINGPAQVWEVMVWLRSFGRVQESGEYSVQMLEQGADLQIGKTYSLPLKTMDPNLKKGRWVYIIAVYDQYGQKVAVGAHSLVIGNYSREDASSDVYRLNWVRENGGQVTVSGTIYPPQLRIAQYLFIPGVLRPEFLFGTPDGSATVQLGGGHVGISDVILLIPNRATGMTVSVSLADGLDLVPAFTITR